MPHASTRDAIAERYRRFAIHEAHGSSPLYAMLATHVASSAEVLAFLERLPKDRRQPNLLFAAVRQTFGLPEIGANCDQNWIGEALNWLTPPPRLAAGTQLPGMPRQDNIYRTWRSGFDNIKRKDG